MAPCSSANFDRPGVRMSQSSPRARPTVSGSHVLWRRRQGSSPEPGSTAHDVEALVLHQSH
eukprot:1989243-Prorocentrum_lima.AAC.1